MFEKIKEKILTLLKIDNNKKEKGRIIAIKSKNALLGDGYKDGLLTKIIIYALMILISFVYLQPLLEILLTSFMSLTDFLDPEVLLISKDFSIISNYGYAINFMEYWSNLWNSIWLSTVLALVQTLVSAFTGYSFARYKIKGQKIWFGLLIVTFVIPLQVLTSSRFTLISMFQESTGIIVLFSPTPQIVLSLLGQGINSTILILICYSFFKEIPVALDEAAVMDGASSIQTFYHIIIKLSLPVILTVFLFAFVWNWNDTFSNAYYNSKFTILPNQIFNSEMEKNIRNGVISEAVSNSAVIMSILPLVILYLFVQKYFVRGIEQTGLTGQ